MKAKLIQCTIMGIIVGVGYRLVGFEAMVLGLLAVLSLYVAVWE